MVDKETLAWFWRKAKHIFLVVSFLSHSYCADFYWNSPWVIELIMKINFYSVFFFKLEKSDKKKRFKNFPIFWFHTLYIYIVIHRQTCFVLSELFSVARQAKFPKVGAKPGWLKRQSSILPLSHEETCVSEGNLNAYVSHLFLFTYICLTVTESSIQVNLRPTGAARDGGQKDKTA